MTRTRFKRAEKKRLEAEHLWGEVDRSWMRWVRCNFCGGKVCVNNYADRKVRLGKIKVDDGVIMCLNCQAHGRKDMLLRLYKFTVKEARRPCRLNADPVECKKCKPCKARAVLRSLPYPPKEWRESRKEEVTAGAN